MDSLWRLAHLVAAAYWLGGLITLALVAVGAGRTLDRANFQAVMARVGRWFAGGALIAGAVLAVTGVAMAGSRLHGWADLTATAWGRALLVKTILAVVLVALAVVHSIAGARSAARRWLFASRVLSPVILLVTLAIFYLAVRLTET